MILSRRLVVSKLLPFGPIAPNWRFDSIDIFLRATAGNLSASARFIAAMTNVELTSDPLGISSIFNLIDDSVENMAGNGAYGASQPYFTYTAGATIEPGPNTRCTIPIKSPMTRCLWLGVFVGALTNCNGWVTVKLKELP